ncbi:MAG: hypothetical protein J5814_05465 [Bacteroidaceae bacterium]|nr:hypothetical protein [Bacteroidaceae bacterium]
MKQGKAIGNDCFFLFRQILVPFGEGSREDDLRGAKETEIINELFFLQKNFSRMEKFFFFLHTARCRKKKFFWKRKRSLSEKDGF